jgi:hypothetical protein
MFSEMERSGKIDSKVRKRARPVADPDLKAKEGP